MKKFLIWFGVVNSLVVVGFGAYLFGNPVKKEIRETSVKESGKKSASERDGVVVYRVFKGLPQQGKIFIPVFSPDGRLVAFVHTRPEKSERPRNESKTGEFAERIEIGVYDTVSKQSTIHISFNNVEHYAVYAASVTSMSWLDKQRLSIRIGDGDVGYTDLVYDLGKRQMIKENYMGNATEAEMELSAAEKSVIEEAKRIFPEFTNWQLMEYNFNTYGLMISRQRLMLQKDFAGDDAAIWILDLAKQESKLLLDLPDDHQELFGGSLIFGDTVLFLTNLGLQTELYLFENDKVTKVAEIPEGPESPVVDLKYSSPERVLFLIRVNNRYEKKRAFLYRLDATKALTPIEVKGLADLAVDPAGKKMAVCYWDGADRRMEIREM